MNTEKLATIARPYALAAFEYALDKKELSDWEAFLNKAAAVMQTKEVQFLLQNPEVRQQEIGTLFCDILGSQLDDEKKNFILLLAEYRRLDVLPEIVELFTNYRAQFDKTISVQLISAIKLDAATEQKYIDALTKRLKRKVTLQTELDETLLGGALIRAGDMVIDGSVRGKLNRLLESL